ncbi:MAG TPA: tripartite tricarboxylate transporter substrate binding protein [Burkholderiales bacterium]|nr:tripartite tricarboxylate transporter substrate binding protein [Burkholderiales bacterium]
MKAVAQIACSSLLFFHAAFVGAQDYPTKPIRLIAPFAPGGATDLLARVIGQKISERFGQSVLIDNRVGASGNIGAEIVAKAAPDGYTLLMGGVPHAISMSLYRKLGYDLAKDLSPVAMIASFPSAIVLHPSLPARSIKELIALAKAQPGQLNYGSAGNGSPNHLALELFNTMAHVKMMHVPYKGTGQMVVDLVAGQLQLASMGFPAALQNVKSGKLRVIAVTSASRSPLLPDVPTVAETGLPGFDVTSWYGVFGPAALPQDIVGRLNTEIGGMAAAADVKERFARLGAEPASLAPDAFGRYVRAEIVRWSKVVKDSGAGVE